MLQIARCKSIYRNVNPVNPPASAPEAHAGPNLQQRLPRCAGSAMRPARLEAGRARDVPYASRLALDLETHVGGTVATREHL